MYRYKVDKAVTYTPHDFLLFREAPFAVWMERLTLENPDHGIPPDLDTQAPSDDALPQDELVDTLREEGRDVVLVDWQQDESRRRADTLDAMRSGADFIVNGMLALGPLSGNVNLLMRTSGYSDFGDFLYIPCDTQDRNTFNAAFRLCFMADLLHSLQGQLPPQMLLVRGDADVKPLQTEDHIYYYRAVKQRFMNAMRDFRKHRMPDPSLSSHFGRWSECASEVLRQRAMSNESQGEEERLDDFDEAQQAQNAEQDMDAMPMAQAAGSSALDMSATAIGEVGSSRTSSAVAVGASAQSRPLQRGATLESVPTLAEQASLLAPNTYKAAAGPGQTPNLARFPRLVPDPPPRSGADNTDEDDKPVASDLDGDANEGDGTLAELAQHARSGAAPIPRSESAILVDAAAPKVAPTATFEADTMHPQSATATATATAATATTKSLPPAEPDSSADAATDDQPQRTGAGLHDPLQDLAFIGSSAPAPLYDAPELSRSQRQRDARAPNVQSADGMGSGAVDASDTAQATSTRQSLENMPEIAVEAAPAPTLREAIPEPKIEGYEVELIDPESLELEPREPHLLPPDFTAPSRSASPPGSQQPRAPARGSGASAEGRSAVDYDDSLVDLDSAPAPTLMPISSSAPRTRQESQDKTMLHDLRKGGEAVALREPSDFSSSLQTSEYFDDRDD